MMPWGRGDDRVNRQKLMRMRNAVVLKLCVRLQCLPVVEHAPDMPAISKHA